MPNQSHHSTTRKPGPRQPPAVKRKDNRLIFTKSVNPYAHRQFMWCLSDCLERGYQDIILDLSLCQRAFPNGVLPVIAGVDALRRDGIDVYVILPANEDLHRLFANTNWAHLLEPESYSESTTVHPRHAPARRFRDAEQQHTLVGEALEVLLGGITSLQRDDLGALEWSMNEITDNVLTHADCDLGGILQVSTFENAGKVAVGVTDSGRGILESLRESHRELTDDADAIYKALEAGVTRHSDIGQGNGMAGALRIAMMSGGSIEITSGRAQVLYRNDQSTPFRRSPRQTFHGTFVYFDIDLDTRFDLSEALDFGGGPHRPVDVVEALYETDDGRALNLRLRDEEVGFGSRMAGRQIRTKALNLLNAEPDKPLLLDWAGVPLISSSFADELVGKLFATLGPLTFSLRVRNTGMRPVVHGLIDKAIMQRAGQTLARARENSELPPSHANATEDPQS